MTAIKEETKTDHIKQINKSLILMSYDAVETIFDVTRTVVDNGNRVVDNEAIQIMPIMLKNITMPERLSDIVNQMKKDGLIL